ncbi:MAG: pentapeptide repeat-containing protein [Hyphomicrobiaceae bacterium]
MSDIRQDVTVDDEAPVNPYSLLQAVNDSSDTVHFGWLIFIGIMSYLLIAVAGVTHKDLLLSRDIPLPMLQVPIDLTKFFLFAPIILVLFHAGIVTQLVMIARKTLELDKALRVLEVTDRRTHPLRLELHNFFFVQAIAGPDRSRIVTGLLQGMTWMTLVVLPVVLLLYVQLSFLPYHDVTITWAHRITLVLDIGMLTLIGVFLSRPEQSFGRAVLRAGGAHPFTGTMTIFVLVSVAAFSFLLATVPGERLEGWARTMIGLKRTPSAIPHDRVVYGYTLPFDLYSSDGSLFGIFERNINLTDTDLVNDKEATSGEVTLSLRNRDLRGARLDRSDIHFADLTGAILDGASLVGTDLSGVRLHCARTSGELVEEGNHPKGINCPLARGVNFSHARLSGAKLDGTDFTGSIFREADLAGAVLTDATLIGANFYSAHLERADLSNGSLMLGANFGTASLQGANLTGSKLFGADFSSAGLQGATLDFANLEAASFSDAKMQGASLFWARLAGAELSGADVEAANLREAWVWLASTPALNGAALAELGGLRFTPPSQAEIGAVAKQLELVTDKELASFLGDKLKKLSRSAAGAAPLSPEQQANLRDWQQLQAIAAAPLRSAAAGGAMSLTSASADGVQQTPGAGGGGAPAQAEALTTYLGNLACKVKWSGGAVATGLARRAQSQLFSGNPVAFYDRIRAPGCTASVTVSADVLKSLADRAEALRQNDAR